VRIAWSSAWSARSNLFGVPSRRQKVSERAVWGHKLILWFIPEVGVPPACPNGFLTGLGHDLFIVSGLKCLLVREKRQWVSLCRNSPPVELALNPMAEVGLLDLVEDVIVLSTHSKAASALASRLEGAPSAWRLSTTSAGAIRWRNEAVIRFRLRPQHRMFAIKGGENAHR
jgi:hypothetical protein